MLIITALVLLFILLLQPLSVYLFHKEISILFPKGLIGLEQRNLLLIIQAIMLMVIVPVYILTFYFSYRYRSDNKNAIYDPDLVDHKLLEVVWWGLPLLIVIIIGWITWVKTMELDPYKPIASDKKPLRIEAVALQWKWLFIYPEQGVAAINEMAFPVNTPLQFKITSDAPMNSFWLPALGGQIYAMPGMTTELNLIANEQGVFRGSSANISGKGFAGMTFAAHATSEEGYKQWLEKGKNSSQRLDWNNYLLLRKPSENVAPSLLQLSDNSLFHQILMLYMQGEE